MVVHQVIELPTGTLVFNMNGNEGGGWLDFWRKHTNHPRCRLTCSKYECTKEADRGGHVRIPSLTGRQEYIIPLCTSENCWNKALNKDGYEVVKVLAVRAVKH